jgi:hypothetical protein
VDLGLDDDRSTEGFGGRAHGIGRSSDLATRYRDSPLPQQFLRLKLVDIHVSLRGISNSKWDQERRIIG